ncbi:hypothetical protein Tco_1462284, partial [Tanacetum coccineum]
SPEVYFGCDTAWFPETDEIKVVIDSLIVGNELIVYLLFRNELTSQQIYSSAIQNRNDSTER